jgi:aconitate hydratase
MARGTFSNPRLRNALAEGKDGGFTRHIPSGDMLTIYSAAMRYKTAKTPLVIIAGKDYGTGSSRDWAAKGTYLLGVAAVIAESYERIHRTNLVCMGVLPLQFPDGINTTTLKLDGSEQFTIRGISSIQSTLPEVEIAITRNDGGKETFTAIGRIDTPLELAYFRAGGLMRKLRQDF